MKKIKDLLIIAGIYLLAYGVGALSCFMIPNIMLRLFVFDIVATIVTFVFSVLFRNSSVYDAYWSLTPMVMSIWLFIACRAFSFWQILFLIAFNIWSARLTINWMIVFTDFSYEDWRYKMFRSKNKPPVWQFINFTGIHMMPTLVVFAGMLPLFEIVLHPMNALVLPGIFVLLFGVLLEFFADRQMHQFLRKVKTKRSCSVGLWAYSRHPNYLGEITVWLGTFLAMLPFAFHRWYYLIGALAIAVMFNVVSIPMMEKRQMERRPDYASYRKKTRRLLLLPKRQSM